ncbi:MAG TPA: hypothetical protein VI197_26520 [Polyangiaceae bacterium]
MRARHGIALAWLMAVPACAGSTGAARDAGGPKYFQAPPKPGFSITASQKCECYACDPGHCCGGGDESSGDSGCAKGYDFTDCDMAVESCTSRCFQKVWRVPNDVACDSRRPAECCAGG